jgi:hypothetical protein
MHFEKFVIFSGTFSGDGDFSSYRQILGKLFSHSKRAVHLISELYVSFGGLGNFFFI